MSHKFFQYNLQRNLQLLILIVFSIVLFVRCGESGMVNKLDSDYLKGTSSYLRFHKFKGAVLSLSTKYIYSSALPALEDSIALKEYIDDELQEFSLKSVKEVTTFSPEKKIIYDAVPQGHDTKYNYDENGYLMDVSLLGGRTKKLYYKTFFKYNQDTTSCSSEEYKMKKIKNFQYGEGLDYNVVDSLNLYGPDTTGQLCIKAVYEMNKNGLRKERIEYDEQTGKMERKTITEHYNDNTLKITYDFIMYKRLKKASITRADIDTDGKVLKLEEYYLNDMNTLEESFDFTNNFLIDLNVADKGTFRLNKINKPIYDSQGNQLSDENDSLKFLVDEHGNWYAKILFDSPKMKVIKKIDLRDITYQN